MYSHHAIVLYARILQRLCTRCTVITVVCSCSMLMNIYEHTKQQKCFSELEYLEWRSHHSTFVLYGRPNLYLETGLGLRCLTLSGLKCFPPGDCRVHVSSSSMTWLGSFVEVGIETVAPASPPSVSSPRSITRLSTNIPANPRGMVVKSSAFAEGARVRPCDSFMLCDGADWTACGLWQQRTSFCQNQSKTTSAMMIRDSQAHSKTIRSIATLKQPRRKNRWTCRSWALSNR